MMCSSPWKGLSIDEVLVMFSSSAARFKTSSHVSLTNNASQESLYIPELVVLRSICKKIDRPVHKAMNELSSRSLVHKESVG